ERRNGMTPETWTRIENAIRLIQEGNQWEALHELSCAADIEGEGDVSELAQRAMLKVVKPW
ncbi:hypothetical protein U2075_14935, partial [Listeria monocytogenes]|uniref:hypothetical protein n=1 Tax=Listeria monocytogenes TaxID=1639 RepID=UPI002FDBDD6A